MLTYFFSYIAQQLRRRADQCSASQGLANQSLANQRTSQPKTIRRLLVIGVALGLVASLGSCSNDDTATPDDPAADSETGTGAQTGAPARLAVTGDYGLEGFAPVPFKVVLAEPASTPVTLTYDTSDGSAEAGMDYHAVTSGTVTIPSGQQSAEIKVASIADEEVESDETVKITVTPSADSAALGGPVSATGIIKDNDREAPFGVTTIKPETLEGSPEGSPVKFEVNLFAYSEQSVTVEYATINDSAVAGEDYVASSGTFEIDPIASSAVIEIDTLPDDELELRESFLVSFKLAEGTDLLLGNPIDPFGLPVGPQDQLDPLVRPVEPFDPIVRPDDPFSTPLGSFSTDITLLAAGIILDESRPQAASGASLTVEIDDSTAVEGDTMIFVVTLSDIALDNISLRYTLYGSGNSLGLPGTASGNEDYIDEIGRVVIPTGSASARVQVRTLTDEQPEGEEIFTVRLDDPQPSQLDGKTITLDEDSVTGTGTITELN